MTKALAIELSDADAKGVLLSWSRKEGVRLENAFRVGFEDLPKDDAGMASRGARVRDELRRLRIGKCPLSVVVPKQSATIRKVKLPSGERSELKSMARFEAEKFIPFNPERHIVSSAVLSVDAINGSDVLIAAIDQPVMEQWLKVIAGTGIEPSVAEVSSLALQYALTSQIEAKNLAGCYAVVHIGMVHTDISLLLDGQILTSRSVMHGLSNLLRDLAGAFGMEGSLKLEELASLNILDPEGFTPPGAPPFIPKVTIPEAGEGAEFQILEKTHSSIDLSEVPEGSPGAPHIKAWVQKLQTNLQRTYEFALREFQIPTIKRIFLCGEGATLTGIENVMILHLGVSSSVFAPISAAEPAAGFTLDKALAPAYSAPYGAALRAILEDTEHCLNLLPEELVARQEARRRRLQFSLTGMMAACLLFVAFLWYSSIADHREHVVTLYTDYNGQLERMARDLRDKKQRIEIIKDIRTGGTGVLDLLEAVSAYPEIGPAPDGRVTISGFKYTMGDRLELQGQALQNQDVTAFTTYLQNLTRDSEKVFSFVDLKPSNPQPLHGEIIYKFEVTCLFG